MPPRRTLASTTPDDLGPWINTLAGKRIPLLTPEPEDIDIRAGIESLAKLNRFIGHTTTFYSVLQHQVVVKDLLPPHLQPYGMTHDFKEHVIGDWATPVKVALAMLGAGDALRRLEAPIDVAVHAAFSLPWPLPPHDAHALKVADLTALATERRDLMVDGPLWGEPLPPPAKFRIVPLPWDRAADLFFAEMQNVMPAIHRQIQARLPL